MDEETMDVVVVGAGMAGTVAAILLARQGRDVVLVERGRTPGEKNLSGGVFYWKTLAEVFPDFLEEAPVERSIVRNTVGFLTDEALVSLDYRDMRLAGAHPSQGNAVSVLRAKVDAWLAEKAEEEGVMVMPEAKVERLVQDESGAVTGVVVGEDEVPARVVVLADGVNSFLARDAGLRRDQEHHELAVGVKSVWKLDRQTINERFGVSDGHGAAYAIVGAATQGVGGGGFIYTNDDSVSIGVVLRLDSLMESGLRSSDIHDAFVTHPHIKPLIDGGELVEYGSHMVNEGGLDMVEPLVGDGVAVIGDAAGLTLNTGLTIRGMDLAVASAKAAAQGVGDALDADDVSAQGLGGYPKAFMESPEGKDLHTYAKAPQFMMNDRLFNDYGPLLADILFNIYNIDQTPRKHLMQIAKGEMKKSSVTMLDVVKDGLKAMRSL